MMRVRHFTQAVTFSVAVAILTIGTSNAVAQTRPDPLVGISKVTVLVELDASGSPPSGVSEARLRTILELKLRTAGLRVLTREEDRADLDINPYIYLEVRTLETRAQAGRVLGYAYRFDLAAKVFGNVPFNRARAPMELWSNSTMAVGGQDSASSQVERIVGELTDSFLNDWLKANPRK